MGVAKPYALTTRLRKAQTGSFYLAANGARIWSNSHLVLFGADIPAIAVGGSGNASPSRFDRRNENSD